MDLHFNQNLAIGYHSGSQISRVVTEDWFSRLLVPVFSHCLLNNVYFCAKVFIYRNIFVSLQMQSAAAAVSRRSFLMR